MFSDVFCFCSTIFNEEAYLKVKSILSKTLNSDEYVC